MALVVVSGLTVGVEVVIPREELEKDETEVSDGFQQ